MILAAKHENELKFSIIVHYAHKKIDKEQLKKIFLAKSKILNLPYGIYSISLAQNENGKIEILDTYIFNFTK